MYSGILVRADMYANFATDPMVSREIALNELALGIAYDRGSGVETFWLNYEALAKISEIVSGSEVPGIKTSEIPLIFDDTAGNADIAVGTSTVTFKGLYTLPYTLNRIKSISSDTITFTDNGAPETLTYVNIPALVAAGMPAPTLSAPTTTTVYALIGAAGTIVIEDAAGAVLGTAIASGNITFSVAQSSGARVYAYRQDIHKNKSVRTSILIP